MVNLASITLDDAKAEEVRRSHHNAITELQGVPLADAKVIAGVKLANGKATTVAHGLGRPVQFVSCSVPRGATAAGYIVETRGNVDTSKSVTLTASGYGATITVDVLVA